MKTNYTHSIKLRVRYGETDQMGYCYYGNYAQYFEVGRVEALRNLGLSYKKLEEDGVMLPVSEFSVKYKAPAFYDDELEIQTKISQLKGARIVFEYSIYKNNNVEIVVANTVLVCVNKNTMSPIQIPDSILEKLSKFKIND